MISSPFENETIENYGIIKSRDIDEAEKMFYKRFRGEEIVSVEFFEVEEVDGVAEFIALD